MKAVPEPGDTVLRVRQSAIAEGNLHDGAGGPNPAQIQLIYSGRDGHARGVHWQTVLTQNQGRVALLQEASPGTWIYLTCELREIALVHGQQIGRPEARLRCSVCDGLEMARRGWGGSGPVSPRRAGRSLSR
jgi:hypothetical protein